MRKIRGAAALVEYLESINCRMSRWLIFKLMKANAIPFSRPAPHVLIFDLDEIDQWLGSDCEVSTK